MTPILQENALPHRQLLGIRPPEMDRHQTEPVPANEVGTKIVHVEMQRCLPVSEQSFDLTWRETTYDSQGQPLQSTLYSGLISLVLRAPAHEKELLANPLGIWIDHFSWSAKE
jgi:type IV secretory pathway TrbF-like protein